MSFHKLFPTKYSDWVRNPEWETLPTVTTGDHKFVGLFAIYPHARNDLGLKAAGNYTVDWGDGTTPEDVNSGVEAQHSYTYTDTDLDDTTVGRGAAESCTFQDTGDTVTKTAHGYEDGEIVQFASIVTTTGISTETPYFVVSAAANTFQVSATDGGSAIALTTDGSGTFFRPQYKQAIVTVTMQTAQTFTTLDLDIRPTVAHSGTSIDSTAPWLDIIVCGSSLSTFKLSASSPNVGLRVCEQVIIIDHAITSMSYQFKNMFKLQSVQFLGDDTSSVTAFSYMFYYCYALRKSPPLDVTSATSLANLFGYCYSLVDVGEITSDAGLTGVGSMFTFCRSLKTVPLFETSGVTNTSFMFRDCTTLEEVPEFDFSSVTTCNFMFYYCRALKKLPESVSEIVPTANIQSMFEGCETITYIPVFDTSSVTTPNGVLSACASLKIVPAFDFSAVTNTTSLFNNCFAVTEIFCKPPEISFSIDECNLDASALDDLYTRLATVSSQTITVTGNPGTSGDDPSIATAKGWTVTG